MFWQNCEQKSGKPWPRTEHQYFSSVGVAQQVLPHSTAAETETFIVGVLPRVMFTHNMAM